VLRQSAHTWSTLLHVSRHFNWYQVILGLHQRLLSKDHKLQAWAEHGEQGAAWASILLLMIHFHIAAGKSQDHSVPPHRSFVGGQAMACLAQSRTLHTIGMGYCACQHSLVQIGEAPLLI
jgi:hypothetical protein